MTTAKRGDTVQVHYTGSLTDGSVFDSSEGRTPLEFTIGSGQLIAGFDQAVEGLSVGQSIEVLIPADQAYGPRSDDLIHEISRDALPQDITLEPGMQLEGTTEEGEVAIVTIAEIFDDHITIDENHALAGQDLNFKIELVQIL